MKSVQEAKRILRENLSDFNQNKQMKLMYACLYLLYKDELQTVKPMELWLKISLDYPKLKIKKTNFVRTLWKYKKRTNKKVNNSLDYTEKLREFLVKMQFNEAQRACIKELIKTLPEAYQVQLQCIGAKHLSCTIHPTELS